MRTALGTILRLFGAVVLMVVTFFVSAMVIGSDTITLTPEEESLSGQVAILVSAVNALILSYLALRSRWYGWKLVGSLFLVQFGLETFMSQIETVVFSQAMNLTMGQIVPIFVTGFVRALIFAPLLVLVLGKTHREKLFVTENTRLVFSPLEWATRLSLLAVLYTVIYFVFGYYVAWQSPELRQFYSGSTAILPFFAHLAGVLSDDPWLVLVQLIRGFLWVLIMLPVVRMMRGGAIETCIALSVTMAVLLSDLILFPNPYMPEAVRMAHFTELWSSMALFGALAGWVLLYKRSGRYALS